MKSASAILKKKAFLKDQISRQLPALNCDVVWADTEKELNDILLRFADIQEGEHMHTDNYIFPAAALYLVLKEHVTAEEAYSVIETAAIRNSSSAGKKLAKAMKLPFLRNLFIRIWDPMTRKMFGPAQGFQNVFYPKKKDEFRMDVTKCPYCKYFSLLGCPELTKIFCANDDRCYGNLPGLVFERHGTLGTGADHCDFSIRRI